MNKAILLGRFTKDPELRYSQGPDPMAVCKFTVAVDRPTTKNSEKKTDFISCICFGKRAETINQYFHKGNKIAVVGRIQISEYTDKSGNKKYATDVVVDEFDFCESKDTSNTYTSTEDTTIGFTLDEDDDGDLPF